MRKILILNTTLYKGGAARVAYDLFENMGTNFDMYIAYGRGKKAPIAKTFYFGNILESFVHLLLVRLLGIEGFGSYFSTKKLIRFIKKEKFDLINIHNLHGYYVNFTTLLNFLEQSKTPILYSLHDEWPITWLPAHSLGCIHCKTGTGACTNTYSYPKSYCSFFTTYMLNKKHIAFSDKLNMSMVCPSFWLKNNIEKSFLKKFNINIIHNSIDTEIFTPTNNKDALRIKHDLPLNKKIIIFSASNLNDKSKGIRHILESAALLKDKDYLFLGLGNGTIRESANVKITGYIYDRKALAELYSLSDVFCFASRAETFLLSAAEALSCGIPVVGFDIPVVRELINPEVGMLTKNDSISLADSIDKILTNTKLQAELGIAGRDLIQTKYSKQIFYSQYKNLYDKK
jgi:glycosyltransferase involved in cell wall biosynthesis